MLIKKGSKKIIVLGHGDAIVDTEAFDDETSKLSIGHYPKSLDLSTRDASDIDENQVEDVVNIAFDNAEALNNLVDDLHRLQKRVKLTQLRNIFEAHKKNSLHK